MKDFDSYTATIMSIFPSAIENNDYSGLENDEVKALIKWLHDQPKNAVFDYAEETEFGWCEILEIAGDVILVTVNHNLHEVE